MATIEPDRAAVTSPPHRAVAPEDLSDTDGLGVAAFVVKLSPQARRGDVTAAMRVYRAEALCDRLERDKRFGSPPIDEDDRAARERWIASTTERCAGVTPVQNRERLFFLDVAVRAGLPEALLAYRREGPEGLDLDSLDPNDPRVITWKQDANAYLRALAAAGNVEAWAVLSTDYQLGIVVSQDYRLAILYQTAVTTARDPNRDPLSDNFMADMARQLPAADVQQAVRDGTALGTRFPHVRKRA